ncbi:hypothetical protein BGZ54_008479 [Gamsiella multidivaricata]|nr:hypothetical protein BGZ54_008479 [Gamsiella multidivaricata]
MFLAGFITGAAIVYSIFTNVEPDSGWNHQQIIYVFGCIGGGIVLGTICWLFRRFLVWILSGLAGLIIALYVLAWRSEGLIRSKGGRIGLLVGAPALGILIGLFIGRRVVILASAIIGAYITVIGIDLFARTGFAESIKRFFTTNPKVDYSLTTNIYIMLGVVGGLIILGLLFQTLSWKHRQRALMAQGRSVHNFNDDWTLFGHKDHAVRPDPTYPDGNYANNYNTGTGYGNTSNARGVDDHTAYNEKSTWNPFKKNKKGDATPATPDPESLKKPLYSLMSTIWDDAIDASLTLLQKPGP